MIFTAPGDAGVQEDTEPSLHPPRPSAPWLERTAVGAPRPHPLPRTPTASTPPSTPAASAAARDDARLRKKRPPPAAAHPCTPPPVHQATLPSAATVTPARRADPSGDDPGGVRVRGADARPPAPAARGLQSTRRRARVPSADAETSAKTRFPRSARNGSIPSSGPSPSLSSLVRPSASKLDASSKSKSRDDPRSVPPPSNPRAPARNPEMLNPRRCAPRRRVAADDEAADEGTLDDASASSDTLASRRTLVLGGSTSTSSPSCSPSNDPAPPQVGSAAAAPHDQRRGHRAEVPLSLTAGSLRRA